MSHAENLAAALRDAEECDDLPDDVREHAKERREAAESREDGIVGDRVLFDPPGFVTDARRGEVKGVAGEGDSASYHIEDRNGESFVVSESAIARRLKDRPDLFDGLEGRTS